MKYADIDEWEYDDTEGEMVAKLKANGKIVDILHIDPLVQEWLKDMKDEEFEPIKEDEYEDGTVYGNDPEVAEIDADLASPEADPYDEEEEEA